MTMGEALPPSTAQHGEAPATIGQVSKWNACLPRAPMMRMDSAVKETSRVRSAVEDRVR